MSKKRGNRTYTVYRLECESMIPIMEFIKESPDDTLVGLEVGSEAHKWWLDTEKLIGVKLRDEGKVTHNSNERHDDCELDIMGNKKGKDSLTVTPRASKDSASTQESHYSDEITINGVEFMKGHPRENVRSHYHVMVYLRSHV